MGFAVRADRDRRDEAAGSKQQNLVLLHPVASKKRSSTTSARADVPDQGADREAAGGAAGASVRELFRAVPGQEAEVKHLPKVPRLPLGLKMLVGVQQSSTVLTGGLVATALIIYSWTVYLDKSIARSFQNLEALKVSTQQVTTANETLKNSMAEQAESPTAGFTPFEPKRAIFLSPAPARPSVEPFAEPDNNAPMPHPLGY
ncbi:hypothetical protein IQ260_10775 [Leptolyngbya cf. ectocarpi LEGE 11479]|uniref:Cell division protein FtsL n=1 Tax=Leptolyngbya cf. ectocarpi LEGE 11479 TaxID=1828722 RepID=A0A928ZTT4_LEPEC|nr:hypothetical protein [Leptolyngbya ectocarpi]MBE9067139.1 hypothetical protein [Leptolyngbya cf. ectocarpi LEGE 11479]